MKRKDSTITEDIFDVLLGAALDLETYKQGTPIYERARRTINKINDLRNEELIDEQLRKSG